MYIYICIYIYIHISTCIYIYIYRYTYTYTNCMNMYIWRYDTWDIHIIYIYISPNNWDGSRPQILLHHSKGSAVLSGENDKRGWQSGEKKLELLVGVYLSIHVLIYNMCTYIYNIYMYMICVRIIHVYVCTYIHIYIHIDR